MNGVWMQQALVSIDAKTQVISKIGSLFQAFGTPACREGRLCAPMRNGALAAP